jgi:hypothetical protein
MAERNRVEPEYRKMMIWVLIALVAAVLASLIVVELTVRHYGP